MRELKALRSMACAGFASMVSMRMCDAMLPALAQDFATRTGEAAKTVSAFALAYGAMQMLYGPLGDRIGKTRVIALAALGCAVAAFLTAFSPSLEGLTIGRMLMGAFAAGIIPLTMAWIGDQVPYEGRQEVLARLLTWTVLGMMFGSWFGGAMVQSAGWRAAFIVVGVLLFLSAGGVFWAAKAHSAQSPTPPAAPYLTQVGELLRSPWTRRLLLVVFLEGALVFGGLAFIPTTLHDRFQLPLVQAGGMLATFGLGGLIYSRVAGRLLKRWGPARLAECGAACLALAFAMLAWLPTWVLAAPACLLAGLGFYLLHNTLQTCATQLSRSARGTGVSMFASALFLGQSCGVSAAGLVVDRFTPTMWFSLAPPLLLGLGLYFARRLRTRLASIEVPA